MRIRKPLCDRFDEGIKFRKIYNSPMWVMNVTLHDIHVNLQRWYMDSWTSAQAGKAGKTLHCCLVKQDHSQSCYSPYVQVDKLGAVCASRPLSEDVVLAALLAVALGSAEAVTLPLVADPFTEAVSSMGTVRPFRTLRTRSTMTASIPSCF